MLRQSSQGIQPTKMLNRYSQAWLKAKNNKGIVAIFFKDGSIRCMQPESALKIMVNGDEWDFYRYGMTAQELNENTHKLIELFRFKDVIPEWEKTYKALLINLCSGFVIA